MAEYLLITSYKKLTEIQQKTQEDESLHNLKHVIQVGLHKTPNRIYWPGMSAEIKRFHFQLFNLGINPSSKDNHSLYMKRQRDPGSK